MGWFFPTFGRPDRFERLVAEAPGGVPPGMVVYLTEGDPQLWQNVQVCQSRGLRYTLMPPSSRLADIYRKIFEDFPYEPCYGIVTDDIWPVTPKWWEMLERAAGDRCIAHAHDPRETSPVPSAACLGGNLVRVIGGITPPDCDCRHNYIDNIWQILGKMFALLRPVAEALVEHHHPIRGLAKMDATYARGSFDLDEDRKRFEAYRASPASLEMVERVAAMLGGEIRKLDLSELHLVVASPMATMKPDAAYVRSLMRLLAEGRERGLPISVAHCFGGSHVGKARESVLWDSMRADATHILFVDDDMGFEPDLVFRLIASGHDFCGVPGLRKSDNFSLCCNFFPGPQEFHPVTKFLKVRQMGFAFILLKRSVVERMCAAYPELQYDAGADKEEWALFLDMLVDRARLSEDLSFCKRWTNIGGEIWADPNAKLIHAGRKEWVGGISDLTFGSDKVEIDITDLEQDPPVAAAG